MKINFATLLLLAILVFPVVHAHAQSFNTQTANPKATTPATTADPTSSDVTLTIPATASWTDTKIDLRTGDVVKVSASGACNPEGQASDASQKSLPLTFAPVGALIAKLHLQGAAPLLIGASKEMKIEEPGHLYLAANDDAQPACVGDFSVTVHFTNTPSDAASTLNNNSQAAAPAANVKSKLTAAAQTWLAGQFGTGATAASSTASPSNSTAALPGGTPASGSADVNAAPGKSLKISTAPLDPKLAKGIDGLPRRVNDEFKNLGDMVNFVVVGSQKDVQGALESANWFVADRNNGEAVAKAILMTYQKKDYLQMPMSLLYLFGRVQDFGYEMAEPYSVVASRHHFRIWKAPFQFNGSEVWVGAGTHDIGFEKDQRNGKVTHKIDPAVDGERDNIAESLQKAGKAKSVAYYTPPDPVKESHNATGGGFHSDGRIVVISLQ